MPPGSSTTTKTGFSRAGLPVSVTVGFHADTVEGLREAFHEAVEDYIETCAQIGKEPQKTYSGQVMFRISPEVHRKAALAAELSGKSLNQWAEEVVFATIMTELAAQAQETEIVMIDATHAKAHRTASSLAVQKGGADG
jgi:predicted HicB family RNase H-like nuclease